MEIGHDWIQSHSLDSGIIGPQNPISNSKCRTNTTKKCDAQITKIKVGGGGFARKMVN